MESKTTDTRDLLNRLWHAQVEYNKAIRSLEKPENFEYWIKQYLLGLVSEVDEILYEINWKRHRRGTKLLNKHNLGRELADVTKYTLCLWEHAGFTVDEMLQLCWEKTVELNDQYAQEFAFALKPNQPVVITDIDGTLGNWRKAFRDWLVDEKHYTPAEDASQTYVIEIDLQIPYRKYAELKEEFEATGGYRLLAPYPDTVEFLQEAESWGTAVIAYTSRPAFSHSRIWSDTWAWLQQIGLDVVVKELVISAEGRISRACQLVEQGHLVVLLEDEPSWALRAANAGITVLLRDHPYNRGVMHENLVRVTTYDYNLHGHFLRGAKHG